MEEDTIGAARALRRAVLGDAYVDRATSEEGKETFPPSDPPISRAPDAQQSLPVLRTEILRLGQRVHRLLRRKVEPPTALAEEVDELMYQIGAYCGMPAAVSAKRVVKAIRAERGGIT